MQFHEWEPAYEAILRDFGYDRAGDEAAREELAALVSGFDVSRLDVTGETVAVVGAAPDLADDLADVAAADRAFVASTAADVCREHGIDIDVHVTDLDKNPGTSRALTEAGTPVAAHAHGDNRDLAAAWVPEFDDDYVLGTTQARPVDGVRNFGGFTDGDRAAFLADAMGAESLVFAGWDFAAASNAAKRRKLRWAARLLSWLEARRDETYPILDGYRDLDWLP
ncbi:6-hydroxymethylpterin diphosphokinase MptE-like protein [Halarchaeum acidiphilum]|uniref:6-hydroxymethylpterin diphosphokinase MptE-like protein n=2 Tax=Halarchaeum acidiphilum TaxID=489138 RepID=UPI0006781574|nr:6-hydroxymethylpterin diphosphokinase MptE-like protein [Halarchaeum acidiphilum]